MGDAINTKNVQRRELRFNSIAEVLAEAERLTSAEKAGKLKLLGNWSAGQVFGHLAAWANYPYDGYPSTLGRVPGWIKFILKFKKNTYLNDKLPQGIRIPKIEGGTTAIEALPTEEGLARLRKAMQRLESAAPTRDNPIFGPMTHEEWKKIQMRHAELHMGYLQPQ